MLLLRLPPEILVQIFDQIGSFFFREDLGRLTVCKRWFEFALPACFKHVTLSQAAMRSLVASGAMKEPSPLKYNLETLELELQGYRAFESASYDGEHGQESIATLPDEAPGEFRSYIKALNSDIAQLATMAQQSRRLRTLHIRAWRSSSPRGFSDADWYLSLRTMQGFLSVDNLSVLILDLSAGFRRSLGDDRHICRDIAALLPTLRILHLRMRRICPDVLKPQDPDGDLRLSELVINLSLTTTAPRITSATHSERCGGVRGLLLLQSDIREQAEALAARMDSPRVVRVLTHSLPSFEILSLDVLTGKIMVLDDDMAWDEDGKSVTEDSEPEFEFLSDDFSSSADD
ncbi:hypothetical protein F5Y10DRAFT_248325 [Nemania abortiva]|nr:hypothetical protein F5Y10DRAFT_248325 [Nemania abortiva]